MSRKGNCWNKAGAEHFFLNQKMEHVWQRNYASQAEAKLDVANYIAGFYNCERVHSVLGNQPPSVYERTGVVSGRGGVIGVGPGLANRHGLDTKSHVMMAMSLFLFTEFESSHLIPSSLCDRPIDDIRQPFRHSVHKDDNRREVPQQCLRYEEAESLRGASGGLSAINHLNQRRINALDRVVNPYQR